MRTIRRRLAVLTLLLLAQQAVALALAGALVCCDTGDQQPVPRMECCKDAGDGHMCPLGKRPAPERNCRLKSGCSTDSSGVLAGAGFVYAGPLVAQFSVAPPVAEHSTLPTAVPDEVLTTISPPSPPPKA